MPDYGRAYNLPGYSHKPLTDAAKASDSKSEPPSTSSSGKGGGKKKAKKNNPKKGKGGY